MATGKVNKANEPMSKDKEEEMSTALIAQLLAEDAMAQGNESYYAEYSNDNRGYDPYHSQREFDDSYEENSEDDFEPKKKAASAKKGKKRKAPTSNNTKQKKEKVTEESLPSTDQKVEKPEPTTKKPKKPVPEGCNTGVYNDLEEKNFIEALELFGRDWGKIQSHVGTRDSNSIRSHAQKHFIKLYRDSVPLPEKVRESGEGYTLSGKPLDPNSSAAKPYLNRNGVTPAVKKPKLEDPMEVDSETQTVQLEVVKKEPKKKKVKSATPSPSNSSSTTGSNTPYDAQGRTSYSTTRLRKQRDPTSVNYGQINKDEDPLTMFKCEPFVGKPGSNTSGSQPFEMSVDSNVLLAMDFHAHLMTTEIIGFLAGEWDKENKRIVVREAFPCRSIETGQNDVNVEMDPTSAIETRQIIEERNMKVVGWYHSHPTFIPDPSLIDIENQRNYQTLCRETHEHHMEGTIEPFVGAIVGPYDPALPASASVINWFYVDNLPRKLIYELKENESISQDETKRLFELLATYKDSPEKVDFSEFWKQDASETKLQKMIKSLGARMPWVQRQLKENNDFQDTFLEKIQADLRDW